jgi:hypothetical protein
MAAKIIAYLKARGSAHVCVFDVCGIELIPVTALQRQGVPSRLVYFADENHWVLKPANSMRWHKEVLSWITKWTA